VRKSSNKQQANKQTNNISSLSTDSHIQQSKDSAVLPGEAYQQRQQQ